MKTDPACPVQTNRYLLELLYRHAHLGTHHPTHPGPRPLKFPFLPTTMSIRTGVPEVPQLCWSRYHHQRQDLASTGTAHIYNLTFSSWLSLACPAIRFQAEARSIVFSRNPSIEDNTQPALPENCNLGRKLVDSPLLEQSNFYIHSGL